MLRITTLREILSEIPDGLDLFRSYLSESFEHSLQFALESLDRLEGQSKDEEWSFYLIASAQVKEGRFDGALQTAEKN